MFTGARHDQGLARGGVSVTKASPASSAKNNEDFTKIDIHHFASWRQLRFASAVHSFRRVACIPILLLSPSQWSQCAERDGIAEVFGSTVTRSFLRILDSLALLVEGHSFLAFILYHRAPWSSQFHTYLFCFLFTNLRNTVCSQSHVVTVYQEIIDDNSKLSNIHITNHETNMCLSSSGNIPAQISRLNRASTVSRFSFADNDVVNFL